MSHTLKTDLYKGLQVLEEKLFPKTCAKCEAVYFSLEDFLEKTEAIPHSSGLKDYSIDEKMVALFRNCRCESTLIIPCTDRRDSTDYGDRKREAFDKLLKLLVESGLDKEVAYQKLIPIFKLLA